MHWMRACETQDILPEGLPPCSTYGCHHGMLGLGLTIKTYIDPPPLGYSTWSVRSNADAIVLILRLQCYIWKWRENSVDHSKAFNITLIILRDPLSTAMCNWIRDLLTGRPLVVKIGTSFTHSWHSSLCQCTLPLSSIWEWHHSHQHSHWQKCCLRRKKILNILA